MISKAEIKLANSLGQKKYRQRHGMFLAEGPKTVAELYGGDFELYRCYATGNPGFSIPFQEVSTRALGRMSQLRNPQNCLALFRIPEKAPPKFDGLVLALDGVQDPGNLGTIIRLCDWFGVAQIICSKDTVDCYNPKVVQASMGSLARVSVASVDLAGSLSKCSLPVYATAMDGAPVYSTSLPDSAVLVMGNEGRGISTELLETINERLAIPQFGQHHKTESLNVAMATAIFLSEFRRPTGK